MGITILGVDMAVKLIASAESSSPIQNGRILYVRLSSFICVEYIIQDMCLGLLDATTRLGMEVIVDGAYIDNSPSWLLWCSSHHVHVHPSDSCKLEEKHASYPHRTIWIAHGMSG